MFQGDFSVKNIERTARLSLPFFALLALFMLNVTALPLPSAMGGLKPQLVLMFVYYWAIYRPTLVPPVLCFALGLLMDILAGLPLGMNALILLVVQWLVKDQRRFLMGQPYITIWAVFGLIAGLAASVQWALYGMARLHWAELMPLALGVTASLFLFPFVTMLLIAVHRVLPVATRGYN